MALKAGRVGVRPDQVDKQGYITGGGGGGGSTEVLKIDTLRAAAAFAAEEVLTLSEAYTDYDLLILVASYDDVGGSYVMSTTYPVKAIKTGDNLGVCNDGFHGWFTATSSTSLTVAGLTLPGTNRVLHVYGVKVDKKEE